MCLTRETIQDLPTAAETSEQYDVACYLHKSKRSLGEEELVQITQDCGDGPPAEVRVLTKKGEGLDCRQALGWQICLSQHKHIRVSSKLVSA